MKHAPENGPGAIVFTELDGTNQLIARYLHGDEFDQTFTRVVYGEPTSPEVGATPTIHWLLTDHLNSVRLVLDESGVVLDQIAYDTFGNIVAQLNPLLVNPVLFASREFDFETGLYYNRARYLDPFTSRWTTQDPLGFAAGEANLYRYVGNTPTLATDPSGNIAFLPLVLIAAPLLGFGGTAVYTAYQSYQSTGSIFNGQIWGAAAEGVCVVGPRVVVNSATDAAVSLLTLGAVDQLELWPVPSEYRDAYDWGYAPTRVCWELEVGLLTRRLPSGWPRNGALGWDVLQNSVLVSRGLVDVPQITRQGGGPLRVDWSEGMLLHGPSLQNSVDLCGGLLSLGGNFIPWRRLPPAVAPLRVPQGLSQTQFDQAGRIIRSATGHLGDDVIVQGSRAAGTARPTSDIDFAIRLSPEEFDAFVRARFGTPNPGSAKERTMQMAIQNGRVHAGEAGLRGVRRQLEEALGIKINISVIRRGGPFDQGPSIPVPRS